MTKRIGVMAVFLAGCAVGGASSQLVVPRASAQQAATLTRCEYTCASSPGESDLLRLGAEGWELAGVEAHDGTSNGSTTTSSSLYCFKRPKM